MNQQFVENRLRVSEEVYLDFEFVKDAMIAESMAMKGLHPSEPRKELRQTHGHTQGKARRRGHRQTYDQNTKGI